MKRREGFSPCHAVLKGSGLLNRERALSKTSFVTRARLQPGRYSNGEERGL
jgi:hypothetical protein